MSQGRTGWRGRLAAIVAGIRRRVVAPADAQFLRLAEASLQGIVIHDGTNRRFVNAAYARMFGYPDIAAALAVGPMGQNVFPEDVAQLEADWRAILAGRQSWTQQRVRRRRIDGSVIWVDLMLGPTTWDGKLAVQAIQIDVSREVEAVLDLERSEARFRLLAEEAVQALMIHDGQRRLFVNHTFVRMLGYSDTAAALADDIWRHVPPELYDSVRSENHQTLSGDQSWWQRRVPRRRIDGSLIWLDVTRGPITWDDRPAVQVCFIDVTAQVEAEAAVRRSERQLTAVLDNLPHVLTLKGADRRHIMVNRAFEARYGLRADDVVGKSHEELGERLETQQLVTPDVRADDLAVLATGRLITRERRRLKPNGERWDSIRTKFPVRGADGAIEGVGTIITDVTELKRAQAQLEQSEAELQRNQTALLRMLHDELSGGSPRDRISRILEIAGTTLGVDAVSVWRLDRPAGVVRCLDRWQRRERGKPDRVLPMSLPLSQIGRLYSQLTDRFVVAYDAERTDPTMVNLLNSHYREQNTTAMLAALVRLPDGEQIHLGFGQHDTRRLWSTEDESFARSMAELVRVCLLQDAIEQREHALRRSEARFRAIIDNLPHVLTLKDGQRRFQVVNRAFLDWFGVTAEQIVGKTPEDLARDMPLMAFLDRPDARAYERTVVETGQPLVVESMRLTASGERRDLMTTRFAVRDDAGAIDGVGLVATDITMLKTAQAALVRRETDLRRNQAAFLQALRDETSGVSLHDRIRRAIRLAGETLGADTVAMWMRDGETLRCVERWSRPDGPHARRAFDAELPFDDFVEFYRLLRERLVVARDGARNDATVADIHDRHYQEVGFTATLAALIRRPDGQEAHFGIGYASGPRTWSVEDESFARSLAELIRVWFLQDALESRERALQRNQGAVLQALREELAGGPIEGRIQRVLALAGATLGVDGAALWRVDAGAGLMRVVGRWRADHVALTDADFPDTMRLASAAAFYQELERRIVLALDDHRTDPRFAAFLDENWPRVNVSASLAALIQRPGGLQDYVVFNHYGDTRTWSVEDQSFARSIAELIGIGLFQDEFERREQALRRNHETLIRIVREGLLASASTQETLNAIVRIAGSTLGLNRAGVWTVDGPFRSSDRVCVALWRRGRQQSPVTDEPMIAADHLLQWFTDAYLDELERDFMVAIDDIETDPRMTEAGRRFTRSNHSRARLNALVQLPDRVAGVVTFLAGPSPRHWSAEDRAFARSVADLVAFVLLSESHRQALAALDLVGQGIYVADGRGEVIYANRVARRLADAAAAGRVPLQALPAPPNGPGSEPGGDAIGEVGWQTTDGEQLDLAVTRTTLPSAGAVTVIADVTELKRREQERRALEAEMRQAAKLEAVGRLAGGIAHDFNNLLGTVLGFAGFLKEDLAPDTVQHEYALRIAQASEHAKEVVKQLLAFTRTSDVERRVMDLRKLAGDGKELLRASLPSSTDLVVDAGLQALPVLANSTQIHQILLNLCLNANDALGGEPGQVSVTLTRVGTPANALAPRLADGVSMTSGGQLRPDRVYARLRVSDNGAGMDAATLARVFDPFFTTKSPGRGTGLGLAVVHGIVAAYEGAYLVESVLGGGSSFSLFLPLAEDAAHAAETPRDAETVRGHESILVVDDERDLLDMMCIGLERLGYHATGCADPLQALEAFRAEPARWAAVVTDEVMPGLKGSALVAMLREISPDCPIVLCTGFSDGTTERQARLAGAAGFFLKPVEPTRIAETIRALLDD